MKKKIYDAAITLAGAAILWFVGWGGLLLFSKLFEFLNV